MLRNMKNATRFTLLLAVAALLSLVTLRVQAQEVTPSAVPADQARLVINEFMASNATTIPYPDDPTVFPDWIEIYNPGPTAVSLNGLAITDTPSDPARGVIPDGITIPADGYHLFYPNEDEFLPFGLSADGEYVGLYLAATGELIDEYDFEDQPQEPDVSMGRIPNGTGDFVITEQPTPGRNNDARPPVVASVERDVQVPASTDSPEVTASITDDGTVITVTLTYSSTGGGEVTVPMTQTTGNNWSGSIPAFPDDTVVRYFVTAVDNEGNTVDTRLFSYLVGYVAPVLFVNEIVADSNELGHEDLDDPGRFPDWAELYNPGDEPVSLDGLTLTDNAGDPTKYRIPDGKTIPAGGYLMLYLDEEPEKTTPTSEGIHADFALSRGGEYLGIYGGEGAALIHGIEFGEQFTNIAIGLYPDGEGEPQTLVCTTPGATNMLCDETIALPLTFGAPAE